MTRIKKILTSLLFCVTIVNAFAQVPALQHFTEDPVVFLEEVKSTFEYGHMPKNEVKDYMEYFTKAWNSSKCTDNMKNATYNTFNLMVRKRIQIFPYYQIYLNSLVNFLGSKQGEQKFEEWQKCVTNILYNESFKSFANFLDMSENLFISNSFYYSPAYECKGSSDKYEFEYDKEVRVIFPEMTLTYYNKQRDSIVIYNTKGVYYPTDNIFKGRGGKVNWTRGGLPDNLAWAELEEYQIDLKRGGYTADSITFYNKEFFTKPIKGKLVEKVISEKGNNVSYPRFESYDRNLSIINMVTGVDFSGGISMRGPKVVGVGDGTHKASLIFKKSNIPFILIKSSRIELSRKENLKAEGASLVMLLDNDSITHPYVTLKYDVKKKNMRVLRIPEGIAKSPFDNTFHKVSMYFEEFVWNMDQDYIDIKMVAGNYSEGALFESKNYFRLENYDALKGMDLVGQLTSLRNFVLNENGGYPDFLVKDYGQYIKSSPKYFLPTLVFLGGLGFLTYDAESEIVHVNEKALDYIEAYTRKKDYDVILFSSFTKGEKNAMLDLKNYDMEIYGVKQVYLSDSQNVTVYPTEQKLVLKQNRNFDFKGVIQAGLFTFFGQDFKFDYDKFLVYLNNVDSVRMKARAFEEDIYGNKPLMNVKSVIEKLNGTLEIDDPNNKSSIKDFSKYPVFNSETNSYVYYDKKYIQRGLYKRDKFYFYLDPFTIDSLDNFTNEGIRFPGELISANIFPSIRESLGLQPDYSLGFTKESPPEGYPLYGNRATFNNTITLNNNGLGGEGSLKYVTSTSVSKNFVFMPDSVNALALTFDIEEKRGKPEYPQAHGDSVSLNFRPYKDQLRVWNQRGRTISTHNEQADIDGLLTLSPKSLVGRGLARFGAGNLTSNTIRYTPIELLSDTANFFLQSEAFNLKSSLSFSTENVRANVNFETRKGEFKSNGSGSVVRFPALYYMCFMQSFTWDMDTDDIEIGESKEKREGQKDINLKALEFISTHPKQDSLRFEAMYAKFNPRKNLISAEEVDYINVADALIYPDSGKVEIQKNAVMKTFTKANIAANSITKLHNLYNCTVNVTGRRKYTGSGFYDYIDETKKKQTFYFKNISVDTTYQTFAETEIPEALDFKLSPNFEYKGKVKLQAAKNFLVFDGYTRLTHKCPTLSKTWFGFEAEINPLEIYIPIPKDPVGPGGVPIATSLVINKDSTHLYGTFLSPKKSKADAFILPADGFMFFDKASQEYRISNKEKLVELSLPGNYLSLDTKNYCSIYGEGNMELADEAGQVVVRTYGNATHLFKEDSTLMDLMMYIDFYFDDDAIEAMGKNFTIFKGLTAIDFTRPVYEKGMKEILGKEEATKVLGQLNLYGTLKKLPDEMNKTIFITDLKMRWDKNSNSFVSIGQIGLGGIGKAQINKFVDGKIEIVKKKGGDIINIYLELDEKNWYYFNYNKSTMLAVSSNSAFNDIIKELKADKRKKVVKGSPNYFFNICPPSKKTQFLRKDESFEDEE